MKGFLLVLGAFSLGTNLIAAPTCVYRNGNNDGGTAYFVTYNALTSGEYNEAGDTVTLQAGTPRNITEVSLIYYSDVAVPSGTEKVIIRFYQEDGTSATSGAYTHNRPNTLIWASAPIPVTGFGAVRVMRIPVPSITVPDTFIWTAQFTNVPGTAGNRLAYRFTGPPTIGSSDSSFWNRYTTAGGFALGDYAYTNGATPEGSYGFTIWADGGPVGVVYDNTMSDNRSFYFPPAFDINTASTVVMGDDVMLEGSYRNLTEFQAELYTDVAVPNGDEEVQVTFWNIDAFANGSAVPLYTSAWTLANLGAGTPDFNITTIPLPNVTVPDQFICAVSMRGVSQAGGDSIGWRIRSSPNPGQSELFFPYRNFVTGNVNGWTRYWFGNPTRDNTTWPAAGAYNNPIGNFSFKLTASTTQNLEYVTATPGPGSTIANTAASVLVSDDVRWEVRPGAVLVATNFPERVTWTFRAKSSTATALSFTIESSSTVANMRQRVFIQHDNASFTQLEDFTGLPTGANPDRSVTLAVPGTLSDYIRNDGTITIRTEHKNSTAVLVYPWRIRYDRVYMTHTQ